MSRSKIYSTYRMYRYLGFSARPQKSRTTPSLRMHRIFLVTEPPYFQDETPLRRFWFFLFQISNSSCPFFFLLIFLFVILVLGFVVCPPLLGLVSPGLKITKSRLALEFRNLNSVDVDFKVARFLLPLIPKKVTIQLEIKNLFLKGLNVIFNLNIKTTFRQISFFKEVILLFW